MAKPLKEGYLMKAHPKEGIFAVTVWQKRYFVLWPSGTMEYYTSYQKSPEEYCSTMDLKETIDILAPVSVGKKHNVIKITVKKNKKDKDYWLDCDCPTLLNEWVNHIVNVAGLSPEDQDDCFAGNQSQPQPQQDHVSKRRLPSLPMVMNMEYEVPKNEEGEHYEEISPVGSPVLTIGPRRYSKSFCSQKQNIKGTESVKGEMLKRSPLPDKGHHSSPPPPSSSSHSTSPPANTSVSSSRIVNPELQRKLSVRRQEMYGTMGTSNGDVIDDGEAYEEVQFTTEVTVGERTNTKVTMRNKNLTEDISRLHPRANTSTLPTWDNQGDVTPEDNERPPRRVPLRDSVLLGSGDLPSPPPVPPREPTDNDSSPPLYLQHDPPPPIPDRSASRSPRPKIQSYYTTEIKQSSSSTSIGYQSESSEQSSSSGDATVTKSSVGHQHSISLLAAVVGGSVSKPAPSPAKPKPLPSTSVKPKLDKPAPPVKPKKPKAASPQHHPVPVDPSNRVPAKLPKPYQKTQPQGGPPVAPKTKHLSHQSPELPPKPLAKPSKHSTQVLTQSPTGPSLPPKRIGFSSTDIHKPPPPIPKTKPIVNGTANTRPPMPLPKVK